ncbi:MAG: aminopeptidase P family protein [Gemmatimonadetes bacterium]|nr:aminopeptidase P family protein [Gemmatimonadota bacterium]
MFSLLLVATLATQAPIAELPGAGRPVDLEFTRARRERLMERIGQGLIVVPAALERDLEVDVLQDNGFRQDDYFFYLSGLETPSAWLVLMASTVPDSDAAFLFLPPRNPAQERWTGIRLGPGGDAARLAGIANVLGTEQLDSVLTSLQRRNIGPLYAPLHGGTRDRERIRDWLYAGRDLRNAVPVLDSMRVVKDAVELARLRRAVSITTAGLRAAMQAVQPGMWEYQLEATVEYTFRNLGADRLGFPSIIGSGPNSTTLHYDAGRRQIQEGELVVMDVGAEYGQYTADVTRTIPVTGKFSARQRAIYDLVLATQQAAMDSIRPGLTMRDLNRIARDYLKAHSGDLCGKSPCDSYFTHGLGHWLGMRVHDVGDYRIPLQPGAVVTIEPGIYLPDENFGVRIEDDVLVTERAYELLSADAPRAAADIEAVMRGREPARRAQAGR